MARQGGKRVIGTNDLHNPSVKRGKHSTHSLIARSYVEERPATADESDPVMWEGYDHQYVDLELIEVAKRRNEFQFAQNAIVEHFHPHWGNARTDPTYKKAFRRTVADRKLYAERLGIKRAHQPASRSSATGRRDILPEMLRTSPSRSGRHLQDACSDLVHELVDAPCRRTRTTSEKQELQHARSTRDLVAHFLAVVDNDDPALRDGIEAGLSDLNDHVARLEEHVEH